MWGIGIPSLLALPLLSILPAVWLGRVVQIKLKRRAICPECSYWISRRGFWIRPKACPACSARIAPKFRWIDWDSVVTVLISALISVTVLVVLPIPLIAIGICFLPFTAVLAILISWATYPYTTRFDRIGKSYVCAVCGYDISFTPDRCPECGTIPLKKQMISN